jgi:hypothetical protein
VDIEIYMAELTFGGCGRGQGYTFRPVIASRYKSLPIMCICFTLSSWLKRRGVLGFKWNAVIDGVVKLLNEFRSNHESNWWHRRVEL